MPHKTAPGCPSEATFCEDKRLRVRLPYPLIASV